MSNLLNEIGSGLSVAAKAVEKFFNDAANIDKIFHAFTPVAKSAAVKIFGDVLVLVADASAAGTATGLNIVLDAKVFADVQALIADAKAGIKTAEQVFEAFGIAVPK